MKNLAKHIERYFTFEGRATRRTSWIAVLLPLALINVVISLTVAACITIAAMSEAEAIYWFLDYAFDYVAIFALLLTPLYWSSLAIAVRRLHDCGLSAWTVCAGLVPVLGPLYLLVVCGFSKDDPGLNEYCEGPPAKEDR